MDDPRVVHEDVDAAEARDDVRHGALDGRRVRDVDLPALGVRRTRGLELVGESGGPGLVHVPGGHDAPPRAKRRAVARPMPAAPPVTTATRSAQNDTLTPSWTSRDGSVAEALP